MLSSVIDETTVDFAMELAEFSRVNKIMTALSVAWRPYTTMYYEPKNRYDLQRRFSQTITDICTREVRAIELKEEAEESALEERSRQRSAAPPAGP